MGYVYQAGDLGLWYVGLQAFTVGSSFLANRDFATHSHAYMRRLMEQSGETANLAILDGTEAVFIDQVQCRETMRTIVKLGSRVPLHASGVGKAIFASLPDDQIDALLKVKGLPRITENTITSPETMWASIRVIRQRGWSFDDEEHLPGTRWRMTRMLAHIVSGGNRVVGDARQAPDLEQRIDLVVGERCIDQPSPHRMHAAEGGRLF